MLRGRRSSLFGSTTMGATMVGLQRCLPSHSRSCVRGDNSHLVTAYSQPAALGPEFQVNSYTTASQLEPALASK
jgi:hypothetical protein